MAHLDHISPANVVKIAGILDGKLKTLGQFSRESYGGVAAVAEMFNRLESNAGQELIEQIEEKDQELAEAVRNLMFVFEDMLLIAQECIDDPEKLHAAPVTTPVGRLDEGRAVKDPVLCYTCG